MNMKRFTLMAIAALALIFAVTSCNKDKDKGTLSFKLKSENGDVNFRLDEPRQLPLQVVIIPENTKVKSVSFVFTGKQNGGEKAFAPIKVKRDKDSTLISDLGAKADVAILLSSKHHPLSSSTEGQEIARYTEGTYVFTVKTKDDQEFTFTFKIGAPSISWKNSFQDVKIVNINANGNGSLNLMTGKAVSISDPQSDRYLMNNSKTATFNPGFTSDSVIVNSKTYYGNGCLFYKVQAADKLTFESDPNAVGAVAMSHMAQMVKTIDGLVVGDLVIGYLVLNRGQERQAFLIKVKAINPTEGAGSQGSMTFDWKEFDY